MLTRLFPSSTPQQSCCAPRIAFYSRAPQRSAAWPSRFARTISGTRSALTGFAGSQTGTFFPQDKSDLRDARTYFRINRQNLTFGEVFVGLPSGRKLLMCAQCLLLSEKRVQLRVSEKSRFAIWSWRRDLNPRPSDYKSDALPAELRQRKTSRNRAQS